VYGGPPGDLYILIFVSEHPVLNREGNDILLEIPISFAQAVLGDELKVATIYGDEKLKIPDGTRTDTVFRLRGKGFPDVGSSSRGDQYVRVRVEVPKKLNRESKKLLEKLAPVLNESSIKERENLFKKIKKTITEYNKDN
jgi:molecular chaperone DnaJ